MKKTETYVLRYSISNHSLTQKRVDPTSYNFASGFYETLLTTGEVVSRPLTPNERKMPIFLFDEHLVKEEGKDGVFRQNRYLQKSYETPNPRCKRSEFSESEWEILDKNAKVVKFLMKHNEISHKDASGKELNKNFPENAKVYYNLINLDSVSNEEAEAEIRYNELMGEVVSVMEDEVQFKNLAWGVGINPMGLSTSQIFNLIKVIVKKDMEGFDNFLHHDSDRYLKTVVNRALKTPMSDSENSENFIVCDDHKNYHMNGIMIASSYDSLLIYLKENKEIMEGLEIRMGLKKKETLADFPKKPEVSPDQISQQKEDLQTVDTVETDLQTKEVSVQERQKRPYNKKK